MVERKRLRIVIKEQPKKRGAVRFTPKEPKPQTYEGERRGPKPTYRPEYAKIAEALCAKGATDADLADAFDKGIYTITNWCSTYPEFGEAVKKGKAAVFDPKVERALALRAIGYAIDVEEVKVTKDGDVVRYTVRKQFAPDVTACIFWLKNRNPEAWRDVHKVDYSGTVQLESLTSAELLAQIRQDAAELGIPLGQPTGIAPASAPKTNGTKH